MSLWPKRWDQSFKTFGEMSIDETLAVWESCTEFPIIIKTCVTCVHFKKDAQPRCGECQWKKKKPLMFIWGGTHCKGHEHRGTSNDHSGRPGVGDAL